MKMLTGQYGNKKEQKTYGNFFSELIIKAHMAKKKKNHTKVYVCLNTFEFLFLCSG